MTQTVEVRPTFDVTWRDVEYLPGLLARVYTPRGAGPFHALLEVHGGAWNNGDRTQNAPMVQALAAHGLVVASVDFRLGGQAPYPASMADINYATRWLKLHASEFNATPEALGTLGLSSGGHMVMLSAMRPRDPRYCALPLDGGAELDASVAYVLMGWPVLDPHARYLHMRGSDAKRPCRRTIAISGTKRQCARPTRSRSSNGVRKSAPAGADLPGRRRQRALAANRGAVRRSLRRGRRHHRAGQVPARAGHGYWREEGPNAHRTLDVMNSFVERQLKAAASGW